MNYSFTRYISLFLCFGFALIISTPAHAQNIIYVNHAATGANNGTSWEDAFAFLQAALAVAQSGDEVWVAQGVYRPDQGAGIVPGDREASFTIIGGVSVYGGFEGIENDRQDRDWTENETRLSGDLLGNDDDLITFDNPLRMDNSVHVVSIEQVTDRVVLDGFVISDGTVDESKLIKMRGNAILGTSNYDHPNPVDIIRISNCVIEHTVSFVGSIYIGVSPTLTQPSVTIEHSEMRHNSGKVMQVMTTSLLRNVYVHHNESANASFISAHSKDVYIIDSTISNNVGKHQIDFNGQQDHTLYIWNTAFIGNTSEWVTVAAVKGHLLSVNNIFSGNTSNAQASGIVTTDGIAIIANNVFAFNKLLGLGPLIATSNSNTIISNSIFWQNESPNNLVFQSWQPEGDNVQISHSIIQQALPAHVTDLGGLLTGDPLFLDADGADNIPGTTDDDYRLSGISPAVDAGDWTLLPPDTFDVDKDGDTTEAWPTGFLTNMRIFQEGPGPFLVDMGAFEYGSPEVIVAIEPPVAKPMTEPYLFSNFPNPFSSSTEVTYSLQSPSSITLELFDILGKRVRVLEYGFRAAGEHSVRLDAAGLSTGVYFVRLTAGSNSQTRKMVVLN